MPLKCIKLYLYSEKNDLKKNVPYPTKNFQTHYRKHTYFLFGLASPDSYAFMIKERLYANVMPSTKFLCNGLFVYLYFLENDFKFAWEDSVSERKWKSMKFHSTTM